MACNLRKLDIIELESDDMFLPTVILWCYYRERYIHTYTHTSYLFGHANYTQLSFYNIDFQQGHILKLT